MTVLEAAQAAVVEYLVEGGPLFTDETAETLAKRVALGAEFYMSNTRIPGNKACLESRTIQIMRKAKSK